MEVSWQTAALAALQGLTEFLPISSSGHLVLAEHAMGIHPEGVFLELVLHLGTLLAVLVYYRRRIAELCRGFLAGDADARRYVFALGVGTIPAAAVGIPFRHRLESVFHDPALVCCLLMVTGIWLVSLRWARAPDRPVTVARGGWIGMVQAVALLPGISRSGFTIGMARHLGIEPGLAGEFSFLLSIPALAGAAVLTPYREVANGFGGENAAGLFMGFAVSAVVGWLALSVLSRILSAGRVWWFGPYCLAVGLAGLLWLR